MIIMMIDTVFGFGAACEDHPGRRLQPGKGFGRRVDLAVPW